MYGMGLQLFSTVHSMYCTIISFYNTKHEIRVHTLRSGSARRSASSKEDGLRLF